VRYFVAGAAGFIASNFINRLIKLYPDAEIIAYDNLSSTGNWNLLTWAREHGNIKFIHSDVKNLNDVILYMKGASTVLHFSSNPDISKATTHPNIDFWEGTFLTQNILEAMRINAVKKIIYASGSGVFGNTGEVVADEDYHPMLPISTYGASKLAGEALICSYCHMFDMVGRAYRFANVVGKNQTHGICFDLIRKLKENPTKLKILGNGKQKKGYIYVEDVIDGILMTEKKCDNKYDYFNLSPDTQITVKEIADIVVQEMGLTNVKYEYSGEISWKGDVSLIKMSSKKAMAYGWKCSYTSEEAIRKSVQEMLKERCL
jgi:UDP-glucose 4-epimerase